MFRRRSEKTGSLLLEVVIVSALVLLLFSALAALAITSTQGTAKSLKEQEALWRASEGLEAVKTIAFADLALTNPAIVSWNGTSWAISAGGPEILSGGFSRTVRVKEVERDGSCTIVPSNGTVDPDSWDVESEVTWTDPLGRSRSVELATLRTRYDNPLGACFLGEQANNVTIDTSDAEWFGGKQLREVDITNNGGSDVVIDKITYTWTSLSTIQQIHIEGNLVWAGDAPTGTELNVTNYTLEASETDEMDKTQFRDNMSGTTITLKLTFSDGSSLTTPPFIPN